jgi:hypothetical protein
VRRILYLCALACLVGAAVCAFRINEMPNRVSEVLDEVADHDRAAKADMESFGDPNSDLDEDVIVGVCCAVGFVTCMTMARRARW